MSDYIQFKVNLPQDVYEELEKLAEENQTTVARILDKGIKWQLLLGNVKKKKGRVLIEKAKGADLVEVSS